MTKRLFRSKNNKMIGGVAGGIAEYFEIDPVLVRVLFVVATIGWGVSLLIYFVLWIIVPLRPMQQMGFSPDGTPIVEEIHDETEDFISEMNDNNERFKRKNVFGVALIIIGLLILLDNLLPTIYFSNWWPIVLVAVGIYFLSGSILKKAE